MKREIDIKKSWKKKNANKVDKILSKENEKPLLKAE